jgi:hypothetical protein
MVARDGVRWLGGDASVDGEGLLLEGALLGGAGRRSLTRVVVARAVVLAVLVAVVVGGAVGGGSSLPAVGAAQGVAPPLALQMVAQRVIGASDRGFWVRHRGGVLVASGGGVSSVFSSSGVSIAGGMVDLRLVGVGYGARLTDVSRAVAPVATGDLVSYDRGGLVESYRNGPFGLEQGFTLARRPAGGGVDPLTRALLVDGSLLPRRSNAGVLFVSRTGVVRLRYDGLRVIDASGRRLRAALVLSGGRLLVRVWDRDARYPLAIDPLIQQGPKLVGACTSPCAPNSPGENPSEFAVSVALSGDGNTALIGAPGGTVSANGVGAAWVFTRTGGGWTQQGPELVGDCNCASGAGEIGTGSFGSSVALSADGNTALIGAVSDDNGEGAAWVFTRTAGAWSQQGTKLVGDCTIKCTGPNGTGEEPDWAGNFATSVALSGDGDTALIGASNDDNEDGAAWVFTRTAGAWSQQGTKLVGDCTSTPCTGPNGTGEIATGGYSGGGAFGFAVALSGDGNTALIGADNDDHDKGAAWVFTRTGGVWSQQGAKLVGDCTGTPCTGPNGTGETNEGSGSDGEGSGAFGYAVALSGDGTTALIGADGDDNGIGAAWVFTLTAGVWSQQGAKLVGDCTSSCTGPNGTGESGGAEFGRSVALSSDGNTALISAPAENNMWAAWVFTRAGGVWRQQPPTLVRQGLFASTVALSGDGNTALIATPGDNGLQGAATVFIETPAIIPVHVPATFRLSRRTPLRLHNPNGYSVTLLGVLSVEQGAVIARAKAPKSVVIGRGRAAIPAHKTGKLPLKLSHKALKFLQKHHRLKATLTLTITAGGHVSIVVTKHVDLRS